MDDQSKNWHVKWLAGKNAAWQHHEHLVGNESVEESYRSAVREYLDDRSRDERNMWCILEDNPSPLIQTVGLEARDHWIIAQKSLGSEYVTDFIIGPRGPSGFWWRGVELVSPKARMFKQILLAWLGLTLGGILMGLYSLVTCLGAMLVWAILSVANLVVWSIHMYLVCALFGSLLGFHAAHLAAHAVVGEPPAGFGRVFMSAALLAAVPVVVILASAVQLLLILPDNAVSLFRSRWCLYRCFVLARKLHQAVFQQACSLWKGL